MCPAACLAVPAALAQHPSTPLRFRFRVSNPKPCVLCAPCADKPPLYFQHEGHSRTIVGVEWLHNPRANSGPSVHLLVLDPSQGTSSLEKALRTKEGWQVRTRCGHCVLSGFWVRLRGFSGLKLGLV